MKRPNVILISLDTVRADHLSCYGYNKPTTPNIDALAREGTVFRQNYSTGVWTPPGHASMLTGLYVSEHGVYDTRRLAEGVPTIAEVLKRNGYRTAGFVNNSQVGELVGFDRGHDKFVEVWKGIDTNSFVERAFKGLIRKTRERLGQRDMGAARTNMEFREWIEEVGAKEPFYAFLHYIEPHNPLNPPSPYRKRCLKDVDFRHIDMAKVKKAAHNPLICFIEDLGLNSHEIEFLVALYDGEIEYTDSIVGGVVSMLKNKGLYDDTMILITSDHGEHFGEHGLWSHVASLYEEVLHVPLIVKFPKGLGYVSEVNAYTQHVDIFPTVMEAAGVSEKEKIKTSGVSLIHRGANKYHEYVFAEWEGRIPYFIQERSKAGNPVVEGFKVKMSMVQDSRYKYIWRSDEAEELYCVTEGGWKDQKAITDEQARTRLRNELFRRIKPSGDDAAPGEEYAMDKDIEKNLKSLGYI